MTPLHPVDMASPPPIKLVAVVEAATVTGPAKNLLDFFGGAAHPGEDGAESLLPTLATFQRSRVPVAMEATPNEFVARAREDGIDVDVIRERRAFDMGVLPTLRQAVEQRHPHIIETHHVKSHFLMRLSGLAQRRPWVAFHHGYTQTDAKVRCYNHLDRWSLRAAYRVITVSSAFARDLAAIGVSPERIRVLHNSIDLDWLTPQRTEYSSELRRRLNLSHADRVVLAVGRLSHEKAHDDLVKAFAQLHRARPTFRAWLLIVGDGPERAALEQLAVTLRVRERIIFAGQVSDPAPYYALADVMALPSLSEGSPLVLLEAMAAGIPIVATAVGGVPEMVADGKSARLVAPRQPDALSEAIGQVLDDDRLARCLGAGARATAAERFTPEAHRRARLAIYRELLTAQRAAPMEVPCPA